VTDSGSKPPEAAATDAPERIAFLGMGIMGSRMAANLRAAGFDVVVWNRTRAKAEAVGQPVADTPRAAAERAGVVITMLVDAPEVEAVLFGDDGATAGLAPGTLVVDMSTIAPAAVERIAARLAESDIGFVDAPVTGSKPRAEDGTLTIMAGGDEAAFERARPLLELLSNHLVRVGPLGAGETAKLVNNLMGSVIVLGIAEGVALAAKAGLDVEKTLEAIAGASGSSWILDTWIPRTILADPSQTHFAVELMAKDMGLVHELADANGVTLEAGALAEKTFTELRDSGDGSRDFSILLARRAEAAGASLGNVD
jgi:3-hydroxyisobutyrate dehydrogenase-like beta-hydroxyacid dehydrogenase